MSVDPTLAPQVASHLNDHGSNGAQARLIQRIGISSNSVGEWARAEILRGTSMDELMDALARVQAAVIMALAHVTTDRDACARVAVLMVKKKVEDRLENKTAGGIILAQ